MRKVTGHRRGRLEAKIQSNLFHFPFRRRPTERTGISKTKTWSGQVIEFNIIQFTW